MRRWLRPRPPGGRRPARCFRRHHRSRTTRGRAAAAIALEGPVGMVYLLPQRRREIAVQRATSMLGRSQVVRQWILIPPYGLSNPPAPANHFKWITASWRLFYVATACDK